MSRTHEHTICFSFSPSTCHTHQGTPVLIAKPRKGALVAALGHVVAGSRALGHVVARARNYGLGDGESIVKPTHTAGATSLPSSLTHAHAEPDHTRIGISLPRNLHISGAVLMPSGNENFCASVPTQQNFWGGGASSPCCFAGEPQGNSALMWPVTHGPLPLPREPLYVNKEVHHLTSTLPTLKSVTYNPIIFTAYTRLNAQPRTASASRPRLWPSCSSLARRASMSQPARGSARAHRSSPRPCPTASLRECRSACELRICAAIRMTDQGSKRRWCRGGTLT